MSGTRREMISCGQSNLLSLVLLVSASLVVGISIAALFVSQSAVVSQQQDVADVVSREASNEFVTLVYHGYEPVDPDDPASDLRHTFLFKLIFLSRGERNFFLVVPLITEGTIDYLRVRVVETESLWDSVLVRKLVPTTTGDYSEDPVDYVYNVSGDKVILREGMSLSFASVPVFRLNSLSMPPYDCTYVEITFTAPRDWSDYDFTLLSLTIISDEYYELNRVVEPLGGE